MIIHGHQRGSIQNLLERARNIDINIRWGGPKVANALNGQVTLLNGLEQLQAFKEAGITCPEFTTDINQAREWTARGFIVFGRNLHHTQGKDIVLPHDGRRGQPRGTWEEKDFWTIYCTSDQEWRFHIIKGACIARGQKIFIGDRRHRQPNDIQIRSRRLGWRLDHGVEPPEGLRGIAKKALAACKYELGAVDLLVTGDSKARVLEVNSRPAIRDDYTIGQYCKYLQKLALREV